MKNNPGGLHVQTTYKEKTVSSPLRGEDGGGRKRPLKLAMVWPAPIVGSGLAFRGKHRPSILPETIGAASRSGVGVGARDKLSRKWSTWGLYVKRGHSKKKQLL